MRSKLSKDLSTKTVAHSSTQISLQQLTESTTAIVKSVDAVSLNLKRREYKAVKLELLVQDTSLRCIVAAQGTTVAASHFVGTVCLKLNFSKASKGIQLLYAVRCEITNQTVLL